MKYTKKQREEAILICAIAASGGVAARGARAYNIIQDESGASDAAFRLSLSCWIATKFAYPSWSPAQDAEAAQLLRDGWSPGDPIEVRHG